MPSNDTPAPGPTVGIAMLDTHFPRPVGDIGNPDSYSGPVLFETVPKATVAAATSQAGPDEALLHPFENALNRLAARGAALLGTSCGFLAPFQARLARKLPVPFIASNLIQVPALEDRFGGPGRVGILTFDAARLGEAHLRSVGISAAAPCAGLDPKCHLHQVIEKDLDTLDAAQAAADTLAAALQILDRNPGVQAFALECTNLGPYKSQITAATGRPVFDIVALLEERRSHLS